MVSSFAAAGTALRPSFGTVPLPGYSGASGGAAAGPTNMTVPVGFEAAPDFGLAQRLRGPGALQGLVLVAVLNFKQ